jgi:hypothetical protein
VQHPLLVPRIPSPATAVAKLTATILDRETLVQVRPRSVLRMRTVGRHEVSIRQCSTTAQASTEPAAEMFVIRSRVR